MRLRRTLGRQALGVAIGYLADLLLADPRWGHPVAAFGTAAAALERATYRDARAAGAVHVGLLTAAAILFGHALQRSADQRYRWAGIAAVAAATWTSLGGTSLLRTAELMASFVEHGDVIAARQVLPSLCGRDPECLDAAGLTRAALESVAENTSDAQVAPLLWAALGGAPAVLGYRAVNTLDAMIGYRSPRYRQFGWAAARLDDLANYLPARITATLVVICAVARGGTPFGAIRVWRRDAARHPSPNAGVVEAGFAGALGVQLGGPTQYRHELQNRPTLGDGPGPTVSDLRRAVRRSRGVQAAAVLVVLTVRAVVQPRRP
ncbi:MAG: cobalamin biosynthesis protein [Mycobacteriaceae bacterium]|nr:cobalamin biosynthesis protein [Mycobacteriaceae bacterium]